MKAQILSKTHMFIVRSFFLSDFVPWYKEHCRPSVCRELLNNVIIDEPGDQMQPRRYQEPGLIVLRAVALQSQISSISGTQEQLKPL